MVTFALLKWWLWQGYEGSEKDSLYFSNPEEDIFSTYPMTVVGEGAAYKYIWNLSNKIKEIRNC